METKSNQNKKVVFLDIDGVMNDEETILKLIHENPNINDDDCLHSDYPSEQHLLQLKKIIDETGADIVLSSSWRIGGWEGIMVKIILNCFEWHGLTLKDLTPQGVSFERLQEMGFKPENCYDGRYRKEHLNCEYKKKTWDRGAEIASWLYDHPEYTKFVILDDDSVDIKPYYPKQLIHTTYKKGLTDELTVKAIKILNKTNV